MDLSNLLSDFMSGNIKDKTKNDHVLIIDGLNLFIRGFLAVPTVNSKGQHIGGIVGFLRSISSYIDQFRPTRCIVAFDGEDSAALRKKIYPRYKENRGGNMRLNRFVNPHVVSEDPGESFQTQLVRLEHYLDCLPITTFLVNQLEADDVVGYMVTNMFKDSRVTIVSADKDFIQLVSDKVQVYSPIKKIIITPDEVKSKYGVIRENFLTYRVLIGDDSDSINGVPGIGPKTIVKYFPEMESRCMTCDDVVEYAQEKINNKDKRKIYKSVVDNHDLIKRNLALMTLSDSTLSGIQRIHIMDRVNAEIPEYSMVEFRKLFDSDGLFSYNDMLLRNLNNTFNSLNYYRSL